MSTKMKALKITMISSFGVAALFSVFSLVFYFGDWVRLFFVAAVGFFIGFVGAPEFEPRAFKRAWLFQLIGGTFAGFFVGLVFSQPFSNIFMIAFVGAVVGWSVPYWVKHVPIP